MMSARILIGALLAFVVACGWTFPTQAACTFSSWFEFKGTKLLRNTAKTAYVYVTGHSRVDADGAPNAYHPSDVGKNCAHDEHIGLDCPANAGFPNTDWWGSVLVPDPQDPSKPFVQPSGPTKGFFVATTWLSAPGVANTNPSKYVDSTKIPYLVFPGSTFSGLSGTGFKGDVGIAWHSQTGRSTAFIVADKGGGADAKLGEGSIALYEALGGQNVNARTGAGVAPGKVRFLVFPGSRHAVDQSWPQSMESIKNQADNLLAEIGGERAVADCN